MASVPPTSTTAPPEIHDGRDGPRELIKLVNWLRRRMLELIGAPGLVPGATRISFDIGDNILGDPTAGGSEFLLWQRPVPYSYFNATIVVLLYLSARCTAGTSVIRLRVGGTDGGVDGSIVGSYDVTSVGYPAFKPVQDTLQIARGAGSTFMKLTVIPSGEGVPQFKEGGISLT